MPRPSLSLAVVGAEYPNKSGPGRRFELNLLKPGDSIELRLEPKNPADENAVAVYSARGIQVGYLTAERAPWIGGMIRKGREHAAIFQQQTQWGAVIRIAFDGARPELPADDRHEAMEHGIGANPELDFYPDEEWPDE